MTRTIASVVLLAFCLTPAARAAELVATFQCGDILITGEFGIDQVALTIEGTKYVLPQVAAGSGAKYELTDGAQVLFWASGTQAVLRIDDKNYPTCVRDSPQAQ